MAEAWANKACQKNNHHGIRLEERILKKNGDQEKAQNPIFAEEGALAPEMGSKHGSAIRRLVPSTALAAALRVDSRL